MRMWSMYHSRAAYIIHMYPQRSSDLVSRYILHLQALDISQWARSPISFSANAALSFSDRLRWIISIAMRRIPAHLLLFNYSGSKSDTKGTCTSHPPHNDKTVINVRKRNPVKPYTIRKLQSGFKAIMLLSLSCIMHNGKEKVDYSLLL